MRAVRLPGCRAIGTDSATTRSRRRPAFRHHRRRARRAPRIPGLVPRPTADEGLVRHLLPHGQARAVRQSREDPRWAPGVPSDVHRARIMRLAFRVGPAGPERPSFWARTAGPEGPEVTLTVESDHGGCSSCPPPVRLRPSADPAQAEPHLAPGQDRLQQDVLAYGAQGSRLTRPASRSRTLGPVPSPGRGSRSSTPTRCRTEIV